MTPPTYDDETSGGEILLFEALKRCDIEGTSLPVCVYRDIQTRQSQHPADRDPHRRLTGSRSQGRGYSRDQNGKWIQRGANNQKIFSSRDHSHKQAEIGL